MKIDLSKSLRSGVYLTLWSLLWGTIFVWLNWKISPGANLQYHKNLDVSKIPADLPTNFLDFLISTKDILGHNLSIILAITPFIIGFVLQALHSVSFKSLPHSTTPSFIKMLKDAVVDLGHTKSFIIPFAFLFLISAALMPIYKEFISSTTIFIFSLGIIILPFGLWTEKALQENPTQNPKWWLPSWPGIQAFSLVFLAFGCLQLIEFLFKFLESPNLFLIVPIVIVEILCEFAFCFVVATILINKMTFKKFHEFFQKKQAYLALVKFLCFAIYQAIIILVALLPVLLLIWNERFFLPIWFGNIREYTPENAQDYVIIVTANNYALSLMPFVMLFIMILFYVLSGRYIYKNQKDLSLIPETVTKT